MKFLVEQYGLQAKHSSEQYYICCHTDKNDSHEVKVRPNGMPIYEIFDLYNPDVYITHCDLLTDEILQYFRQEKSNIKMLVSVTGSKLLHVKKSISILKENKVECRYFGDLDIKSEENLRKSAGQFSFTRLLPCCDINIEKDVKWVKLIDMLVLAEDEYYADAVIDSGKIEINNKTYHKASHTELIDIGLMSVSIAKKKLYHNYKEIIFTGLSLVKTQSFLDAIHSGNKVYYIDLDGEGIGEYLKKVYKIDHNLNYFDENKIEDFESLKKHVLEKHSSERRVKTLLSQLPQEITK